jgi:hypothetical protein
MCAVQARQGRAAHSIICLDGEQGFVDGHLALFEGLPRPGSFSAVSKCCAKPCAGGAPSSTTHTSAPIVREFVLSPQLSEPAVADPRFIGPIDRHIVNNSHIF